MALILLVDDEVDTVKRMASLFERRGVKAVCAFDGDDAVRKYKETNPDFVLLDLFLPRMNGYEAFEMIRLYDPQAKIFIMSAENSTEYVDKARKIGMNGYIMKPVEPEVLSDLAEKFKNWKDEDIKEFLITGGSDA